MLLFCSVYEQKAKFFEPHLQQKLQSNINGDHLNPSWEEKLRPQLRAPLLRGGESRGLWPRLQGCFHQCHHLFHEFLCYDCHGSETLRSRPWFFQAHLKLLHLFIASTNKTTAETMKFELWKWKLLTKIWFLFYKNMFCKPSNLIQQIYPNWINAISD